MSEQHTPGPWKYYVQRTCDGYETHTIDSEAKLNPYEGNRVCSCGGMKEEDGHLIAAAPELLTALKVIAVWAENPESDATACLKLIHDKAMNCIAKAKGKQE